MDVRPIPRAHKTPGAHGWNWSAGGGLCGDGTTNAVVYNVGNFTDLPAIAPALLTIDGVETTFHEFGHALPGNALTRAPYRSLFGTSVDRDYVEMSRRFSNTGLSLRKC